MIKSIAGSSELRLIIIIISLKKQRSEDRPGERVQPVHIFNIENRQLRINNALLRVTDSLARTPRTQQAVFIKYERVLNGRHSTTVPNIWYDVS
jgi:hypothetical protein